MYGSYHFCEQSSQPVEGGSPGDLSDHTSHGSPFIPTAILGMHTLMSNQQYYQALGSSSIVNKEGLNSEYTQPCLAVIPFPCRAPRLALRGHLGRETPPPAPWCRAPILWFTAHIVRARLFWLSFESAGVLCVHIKAFFLSMPHFLPKVLEIRFLYSVF